MADYTLSAKITGDASGFTKAFQRANDTLNNLSEKTKAVGDRVKDFGQRTAMLGAGITAGVTLPFVAAIKTTADFDSAMRKAGAIAGASAKELKAMSEAALDLGASTSLSSREVAVAMTEMAAKGFDATQVIAAMPGVISAAEASGEDLALTADVVSSALNGFRLEASQSGKVADVLAMAANKTAAGIGDMGYAFKYAAPAASSLGISIEELSAATGIMVNAGLDGSNAGTTLRMAFNRLAAPTNEASSAMSALGFNAVDAHGNFKPLNQIVGELSSSMEGMTETQKLAALSTIFGTEAASGMLILLSEGQEGLQGLTKELENSGGASAEAAAKMKAGIGGALENLGGAIESATISVMSQLTPFITKVAKWVTSVVEKFNGLDDGTKKMIAVVGGILAVAGPLLTVFGFMAMGIGGLISAFSILISPVGLVIAAIALLVGAFVLAWTKSEGFRNAVIAAIQNIVAFVTPAIQAVSDFIKGILAQISAFWQEHGAQVMQAVTNFANIIVSIFNFFLPAILFVVQSIWGNIKGVIQGAINIILGIVKIFTGLFTADWSLMWDGIKQLLSGALQFIWNLINLMMIGKIFSLIKGFVVKGISVLKTFATKVVSNIKNGFNTAVDFMLGLPSRIFSILTNVATKGVSAIKTMGTNVKNKIIDIVGFITKPLKDINLFTIGKNIIQGLINGVGSMVSGVGKAITSLAGGITETIKDKLKIFSPSRVMKNEVGRFIPQGVAVGIEADTSMAVRAMEYMNKQISMESLNAQQIPSNISMQYAREVGQSNQRQFYGNASPSSEGSFVAKAIESLENTLSNLSLYMDRREVARMLKDPLTEMQDLDKVRLNNF